jgi:TRAP-type C4-dicarboxylate transport system substrate-binding protein
MRCSGLMYCTLTAAAMAFAPSAQSQTNLRIDSWLAPTQTMNAAVLPHFAKAVEEGSQGRIKVSISFPPNPNPATFIDRLTDGISDVMWSFHGYNTNRFLLTQIVELPGLDANCEQSAIAYQRIHDRFLDSAGEHKGIKLLSVFTHGAGILHTRQPVTRFDHLKGLKIRTAGGINSEVANALGVVQVPAPANKVYEIVSQGVADGSLMPFESKETFKLKEVAPYSLVYPGGFYYGSFWMAMNQAKYDKLSKADREAIDKISGEALARVNGKAWDEYDEAGRKAGLAAGNTYTVASPEFAKQLAERLAPIERAWVDSATKKGVDGRAALDALRAEVKKLKSKS